MSRLKCLMALNTVVVFLWCFIVTLALFNNSDNIIFSTDNGGQFLRQRDAKDARHRNDNYAKLKAREATWNRKFKTDYSRIAVIQYDPKITTLEFLPIK